jgi:hypothetical protein
LTGSPEFISSAKHPLEATLKVLRHVEPIERLNLQLFKH